MKNELSQKEMETAFYKADPGYDGLFYTGVKTTGIFCKPSCTAKKPLKQNIEFFPSVQRAMYSGFRACKKCNPMSLAPQSPAWLEKIMHAVDADPSVRIYDSQLATFGVNPATARRYFLKHYAMTFQAFCRAKRMGKAFEQIKKGSKLDDVALDHGYESLSGFRETFSNLFGKPPVQSKESIASSIYFSWIETPVGPMIAAANDHGVCMLEFSDRRMLENQFKKIKKYFGTAVVPGKNEHIEQLEKELAEYFSKKRETFTCKLDYPGTDFQKKVWGGLQKIPYGKTVSYQDLAKSIGHDGAVRAVGTANGMNRIAIVIPCHRVINKSGELGGYGGGKWRKQYLLELENSL